MSTLTFFSCGAGVQSTAIALLMHEGAIPMPDHVIFADTGAEPPSVYATLDRLEALFAEHGVPLHRVSRGGAITDDVLDPYVFATMPAFTITEEVVRRPLTWRVCDCDWGAIRRTGLGIDDVADRDAGVRLSELEKSEEEHVDLAAQTLRAAGLTAIPAEHDACQRGRVVTSWHEYTVRTKGKILRQCTGKYKVEPVERKIRELAGAPVREVPCKYCNATGQRIPPWALYLPPGPCSVCRGAGIRRLIGSPPKGTQVKQIIGFSTDEIERVTTSGFPSHVTPVFPLIDNDLSRVDCQRLITARGWTAAKSACEPCPYHDNRFWREMRDNRPDEWARAVAFDKAFREAPGLNAKRYLHPSCLPLDEAPIDELTGRERATAQGDLFAEAEYGCSPYACPSSQAADDGLPVLLPMPTLRSGAA